MSDDDDGGGREPPRAAPSPPVWRLLRDDGSVLMPALRLRADGSIEGSTSSAEAAWKVEAGRLHLLDRQGATSTLFDRADADVPGRARLVGRVMRRGLEDLVQILEQAPEVAADAIGIEDVIDVEWRGVVRLRAAERVVAALERREIHFGRRRRPAEDEVIEFGIDAAVEPYASFGVGASLCTMGAFSYAYSILPADVVVGRYSSIATGVSVFGDRHPMEWATTSAITYAGDPVDGERAFVAAHRAFNPDGFERAAPPGRRAPAPSIGHDVWIGQNVQLARGIRIGDGAVIAAGAVLTRDVPPYAVVAGVPARVVRMRFEPALVAALRASRWWEFDASVLRRCEFRTPERFVAQVDRLPDAQRWSPPPTTIRSLLAELRA